MAVQDLNGQFGAELKEDFLYASAAATDRVTFQLFANRSIVLTKKGGTAPGASEDQIEISAGEKYTVNLTLADIEKLSPYTNLTYILYRRELFQQMPYDPVIFTGNITLTAREGETIIDATKNPRNIYNMTGADVESLAELNELDFAWQTGDMVTLGTNKTLYRYNGTTFEIAPGNCKKYVALMTGGADANAPITAGPLVVGRVYQITNFATGDNFSNVAEVIAGTINTTNCIFLATGTTPTVYTNESELIELGGDSAPAATILENSIGTIIWYRSGVGSFRGYCKDAFLENKVIGVTQASAYNKFFTVLRQSDSLITLNTEEEGSGMDSLLSSTPVIIYVYD